MERLISIDVSKYNFVFLAPYAEMKTTLQSLNFPVPIILIPRELDALCKSELTITQKSVEYKYRSLFWVFGYHYRRAETEYNIENGISLTKFTIAFWYYSDGNVVRINNTGETVIEVTHNNNQPLRYK